MIFSERGAQLVLRRLLSAKAGFVAVWILAILWGERWVFQRSLRECEFSNWEQWASLTHSNANKILMIV